MMQPALFASPISSGATLSRCGRYRYTLTRRWAEGAPLLWVMLNPSTADAAVDDPTIRRCVGFAKREGFGAIEVVNLFALRATDPAALDTAPDPVGLGNDEAIVEARARAALVVVAWGASIPRTRVDRPRQMLALLGPGALCLGVTASGAPRHPLYVRGDQALVPYAAQGGER